MNKKNKTARKSKLVPAAIGVAAGLLNGLFGSGGGALVVPATRRFMGIEAHEAHAGAIAIMLPMSMVSAAMYAFQAKPGLMPVLSVSAGGVIGGLLGANLMTKLSSKALGRIFGIFIIAAAIRMIL